MADNNNDDHPLLLDSSDSSSSGRSHEQTSKQPLLSLLDAFLARNRDDIEFSLVEEIDPLVSNHDDGTSISEEYYRNCNYDASPGEACASDLARLCQVLERLLLYRPDLASTPSEYDGSIPLHFAASLGCVPVAMILVSKFPEGLCRANAKGKIPLHYAAREGREEMVDYFLRVAPETAMIPTHKGKLAIHFSAGEGSLAITSALLRQYPKSASLPSDKGKLPLHFCARWGYVKVAEELLAAYPNAVRALDWEGSLPLHDAAREGQVLMAQYLIERFPVGLQTANLRGVLPLFSAVQKCNLALVAFMVRAWPMGGKHVLQNLNKGDYAHDSLDPWILELLLRGAVNKLSGYEMGDPPTVELMDDIPPVSAASPEELKAYKKAKKGNQWHELRLVDAPLRSTAASSVPVDTPSVIVYPQSSISFRSSARAQSESPSFSVNASPGGKKRFREEFECSYKRSVFIPLHAALSSMATIHVVERVLKGEVRSSEELPECDERGRYALHYAVSYRHNQIAMAELLLENEARFFTKEAASSRDETGQLPLHLAIANHADVRIVKKLLELHPGSGIEPCGTCDRFETKTPMHMAIHHHSDASTMFELLRVDPSFVRNACTKV